MFWFFTVHTARKSINISYISIILSDMFNRAFDMITSVVPYLPTKKNHPQIIPDFNEQSDNKSSFHKYFNRIIFGLVLIKKTVRKNAGRDKINALSGFAFYFIWIRFFCRSFLFCFRHWSHQMRKNLWAMRGLRSKNPR